MGSLLDHAVAIALPAAMLYFFFILPLRRVWRARRWVERPCIILSSGVEEDQGESGVYRILVTYSYEIAGRPYCSSRYDFSTGATCGFRGKKKAVDQLAPGMRAVCYVNPADPNESVIERGVTWDMLFWGIFTAILLVTFVFFVRT